MDVASNTGIDLDLPRKIVDNQYLGSIQREITPYPVNVEKISAAFRNFSVKRGDSSARVAHSEILMGGQLERTPN